MTYELRFSRQAKRALTDGLPPTVAAACIEFITSALAENPHRVGKQLRAPLAPLYTARRGEFRIIYDIRETAVLVQVVDIRHRRDAYR